MNKWLKRGLIGVGVLVLLFVAGVGGIIAFNEPERIPPLAAGNSLPGMSTWNMAEVPQPQRVTMRDGAPMAYRFYPGRKELAVVLVHGSSGTGFSMHKLAQAMQAAGATIYSIDLRGHGGSGTVNGDTSYKNQLDDDLVDFVKGVGLTDTQVHRTLAGFSSGGGFVLRTASGANRGMFDAYLAISPYVATDSPTTRPASGGWASVAVPRVVALAVLERMGLPWFQGLPVVRFATDAKPDRNRTPIYSFRLATGMQIGPDWRERLRRIEQPTWIVVGSKDELMVPDQYLPTLGPLSKRISVSVQPGHSHMEMIADPKAAFMLSMLWRQMTRE
jgi:pimeloyl-ACP methyl ester carboxylesterase